MPQANSVTSTRRTITAPAVDLGKEDAKNKIVCAMRYFTCRDGLGGKRIDARLDS